MNTTDSTPSRAAEVAQGPKQITAADLVELIEMHGCTPKELKLSFMAGDSCIPVHGFFIVNGEAALSGQPTPAKEGDNEVLWPKDHPPKRLTFACSDWGNNPAEEKYEFKWGPSALHVEFTENQINIGGPLFYVKGSEKRPEVNNVTLVLGLPTTPANSAPTEEGRS